jgi:predicted Zn finger-like uncharacterized protein
MQIVCPNCSTAYEIPDAVFGGRARKLRCETCGTQWRAGPPGVEPAADPVVADPGLAPEVRRVFGKPIDATAEAEFQQAMDREAIERAAQASGPVKPAAADLSNDSEDPFINLVMAARSRSIEFEPEPPPEPRFKISSPALVGTLLTLFVLSVGFLLLHAR